MINPSIANSTEIVKQVYNSAPNYPHIKLDDFLDETVAETLSQQIWYLTHNIETEEWRWDDRDWHQDQILKRGISDTDKMPDITRLACDYFNSESFLQFLREITGFEDLQADPTLEGGGIHVTYPGGKLNVHNDFNYMYGESGEIMYSKVNLLIYLNQEWLDEWGGHLELWKPNLDDYFKKIKTECNRAVIFNIEGAPHGHPEPLQCPEGENRRSLAFYYYSKNHPNTELIDRAHWKHGDKLT